MESDNLKPADGPEAVHLNSVREQLPGSGEDDAVGINVNGISEGTSETTGGNENLVTEEILDDSGINNSSPLEPRDESNARVKNNKSAVSKEGKLKDTDHSKQAKSVKVQGKSKNEKPSSPRNISATWVKKSKDEKDVGTTSTFSNGSAVSNPRGKQPVKSDSLNDRQIHPSKQSGKSDAVSSDGQISPKAEEAKQRRAGALPNYGFSFKCDQRAEKRREFYSKLEEKIHAKEVEKTTLHAKSKESQEAEIKQLRKSLTFKATPMPSFYQEPAPPKAELQKIPPTRARSPKLGRKKSLTLTPASEENGRHSLRPGRLSLDEKLSRNNTSKVSPVIVRKPQRKSLPKLPSEKTLSSSSTNNEKATLSEASKEENTIFSNATSETTSPTQEQEVVPRAEASETNPETDGNIVIEQTQPILVQEAVALEH